MLVCRFASSDNSCFVESLGVLPFPTQAKGATRCRQRPRMYGLGMKLRGRPARRAGPSLRSRRRRIVISIALSFAPVNIAEKNVIATGRTWPARTKLVR